MSHELDPPTSVVNFFPQWPVKSTTCNQHLIWGGAENDGTESDPDGDKEDASNDACSSTPQL